MHRRFLIRSRRSRTVSFVQTRSIGSCCGQAQISGAAAAAGLSPAPARKPMSTQSQAVELERAFEVASSPFKFGRDLLRTELAHDCLQLGMKRVVVFTDKTVAQFPWFKEALAHLRSASGIQEVIVYDEVHVEPSDKSVIAGAEFLRDVIRKSKNGTEGLGVCSIGGGSVMDSCKVANLMAVHGGTLKTWTNAPIGEGKTPPSGVLPHLAVPTTSGTGSEQTTLAIFDLTEIGAKTGIGNRYLRPDKAIVDIVVATTLPSGVTAASGFDVLSHSIESFTARPYSQRPLPLDFIRPTAQGANPYADIGCLAALEIVGKYWKRAVLGSNGQDTEANDQMLFASTLAGAAFNTSGCQLPHGLSYPISSMNKHKHWRPSTPGWPIDGNKPIVPHGFSVGLPAAACYELTAPTNPHRHLQVAKLLDPNNELNTHDATPDQAGVALRGAVLALMQATGMPNGLNELGFDDGDLDALVDGAMPQQRLLKNAPLDVDREIVRGIYERSMKLW